LFLRRAAEQPRDTNACICGYVVGAICGRDAIPETMQSRVLDFEHASAAGGC